MSSTKQILANRLALFTGGMLLVGVAEAAIAYGIIGFHGVEGVFFSVLICLVPGWLTIVLANFLHGDGAATYVVLIGVGLRMAFVVAGLFAIRFLREDLGFSEFEVWLLVGYLAALALETWVVLSSSRESESVA